MTQNDSDLPAIQEPLNRPQRGMLSLLNLNVTPHHQTYLTRTDAPETLIHNYVRYYYHGTMDGVAQYTTIESGDPHFNPLPCDIPI